MIDIESSLLAAIRERPDEESLRLILADWLEENEDEGGRAHAELIRVQCRIAAVNREFKGAMKEGTCQCDISSFSRKKCRLCRAVNAYNAIHDRRDGTLDREQKLLEKIKLFGREPF